VIPLWLCEALVVLAKVLSCVVLAGLAVDVVRGAWGPTCNRD
jgi:hypothetical protein